MQAYLHPLGKALVQIPLQQHALKSDEKEHLSNDVAAPGCGFALGELAWVGVRGA